VIVTEAELDDQASGTPVIAPPFWSLTDACTTCVAPTASKATEAGVTDTLVATLVSDPESEQPQANSARTVQGSALFIGRNAPGGDDAREGRLGGPERGCAANGERTSGGALDTTAAWPGPGVARKILEERR
jgi:hypothetical protein